MSQPLDFIPPEANREEDDYDRLPEAVRFSISRQDFLWLSDESKARLVQNECEPDPEY